MDFISLRNFVNVPNSDCSKLSQIKYIIKRALEPKEFDIVTKI